MIPKFLIVYRTSKKEIKDCLVSSILFKKIGDIDNRCWIILDIQVFYKGSFIKLERYKEILEKERIKQGRILKRKNKRNRQTEIIILEKTRYFFK